MIDDEEKQQEKLGRCCIWHQFSAAASSHPDKIAVVHASGGARLFRELHRGGETSAGFGTDGLGFLTDRAAPSTSPPVYDGDACFAYSQVSLAVESLSSRLRAVLDGEDVPDLIKPSSGEVNNRGERAQPADSLSFVPSNPRLAESRDVYRPKIVGVYIPPSVEYVVSVLSVLRCGEALMPIDPWWPKDRILSVVAASNVDAILGSKTSFGKTHDNPSDWIAKSVSCPVLLFSMDECLQVDRGSCNIPLPCKGWKQRLFCYLMYTSGSTGNPKGVCGTEQGLLNRFMWMQEFYPFEVEEYVLFKTSISFIDHLQEILGAILTASALVVPPFNELKENIFAVLDFLEAYRISRLTAVPSLMRAVLPALQSQRHLQVTESLKLLVLSGEDFPVLLWKMLSTVFPNTSILNLYGSTEVSGDCTFFDCEKLPMLLETEALTSVPIGQPISNCDVVLVGEHDTPDQGEIHVGGLCISSGCFLNSTVVHSDFTELLHCSSLHYSDNRQRNQLFYRTGDFAQRLENGYLVFLGRKDRIVKINGQRVSLVEVENALRGHRDVLDAAVISQKGPEELIFLKAFLLLREMENSRDVLGCIRRWAIGKFSAVMIPHQFVFVESFPMTSSGKVDYESLAALEKMQTNEDSNQTEDIDLLQAIKKAFLDALMIETVSDEDNFFTVGGNSIAAAHVSYNLGINMRLLYDFPSPYKLHRAILQKVGSYSENLKVDGGLRINLEPGKRKIFQSLNSEAADIYRIKENEKSIGTSGKNGNHDTTYKRLKADSDTYSTSTGDSPRDGYPWTSLLKLKSCSLSRCNRVMYESDYGLTDGCQASWPAEIPRNTKSFMRKLWKVPMGSCVDASPLLVVRNQELFVFIGAHSEKFACVNAKSGSVQWEIKLDGRIEGSAAITNDFSQVVVGCYDGNIYFLDFSSGEICWTFQTAGEVKSQPVIEKKRQLIWCGSYDHNLYALDYKNYQCVDHVTCSGSIFGSPAIDELRSRIYVASTNGRITALSIKASPFYVLWQCDLGVPVFGSISICPIFGNVICCLVDGSVIALNSSGAIFWKTGTDGPIFAGACISSALPSQVLICSRSGKIYSFDTESGKTIWEYDVGEPITASAYVDDNLQLTCDRLVCICTCSGSILVLQINVDMEGDAVEKSDHMVQEFSRLKLDGDIFSSPVMIGGLIFVGCRDDYLHCVALETQSLTKRLFC
ncbi:putative acyl-activating enzyme 19 isoform X2 [Punica granatum]|uniref:Acyl-activating enzyme 19 isoform X2 n=1 Tax=Punica granatum TaxID=22663 RepID=A0A6P8E1K1_PUNGR|nr:putative acyl-activating enzyme 19 isoform X2 [Punica granatum]